MIVNAQYYNTLTPYYKIPYSGIAYGHCVDYDHISRYKGLRQVTHNANSDTTNSDRFITLETPNPFTSNAEVSFYDVPYQEENRLDVIAYKKLGSAQYAWIIAYFNGIEDGFTVREGTRLRIPNNISQLFNSGEILASVSALTLNLGTE